VTVEEVIRGEIQNRLWDHIELLPERCRVLLKSRSPIGPTTQT
jgi:hypothetical protein